MTVVDVIEGVGNHVIKDLIDPDDPFLLVENLLLESGDDFLLEAGGFILLE